MDCAEAIAKFIELSLMAVGVGFAGAAAWWARGAYRAQEDQVKTQQKQLDIANGQNKHFLELQERARRSEAPLFKLADVSCHYLRIANSDNFDGGEILTNTFGDAVRAGIERRSTESASRFGLTLRNTRDNVKVVEVGVIPLTRLNGIEVRCSLERIIGQDSRQQESDLYLLYYWADREETALQERIEFRIIFETADGTLDGHTYYTSAGTKTWERLDPPSFDGLLNDMLEEQAEKKD